MAAIFEVLRNHKSLHVCPSLQEVRFFREHNHELDQRVSMKLEYFVFMRYHNCMVSTPCTCTCTCTNVMPDNVSLVTN